MGCAESSEESTDKREATQRSKKIDKALKLETESKTTKLEIEILMLGERSSGKSELLKQIQILFGKTDVAKLRDNLQPNSDRLDIIYFASDHIHFMTYYCG
ncbi:G protein alpha i subunit-like [Mercenaria mercenaria]|uniref:G protein alpha i subunit-like n=1 Tax=Mercenaria mercenaria TaxID=6596 RepID=UPI00234E4FDC|nr:G protein alpha i subunit-like [Mercenaria mercenaria]